MNSICKFFATKQYFYCTEHGVASKSLNFVQKVLRAFGWMYRETQLNVAMPALDEYYSGADRLYDLPEEIRQRWVGTGRLGELFPRSVVKYGAYTMVELRYDVEHKEKYEALRAYEQGHREDLETFTATRLLEVPMETDLPAAATAAKVYRRALKWFVELQRLQSGMEENERVKPGDIDTVDDNEQERKYRNELFPGNLGAQWLGVGEQQIGVSVTLDSLEEGTDNRVHEVFCWGTAHAGTQVRRKLKQRNNGMWEERDQKHQQLIDADVPVVAIYNRFPGDRTTLLPLHAQCTEEAINTNPVQYAFSAVQATQKMHEAGFTHQDIKPDNFLMDGEHLIFCDCDFVLKVGEETAAPRGTYIHPARLTQAVGPARKAEDWFALAWTLLQFADGFCCDAEQQYWELFQNYLQEIGSRGGNGLDKATYLSMVSKNLLKTAGDVFEPLQYSLKPIHRAAWNLYQASIQHTDEEGQLYFEEALKILGNEVNVIQ